MCNPDGVQLRDGCQWCNNGCDVHNSIKEAYVLVGVGIFLVVLVNPLSAVKMNDTSFHK